MSQPPDQSRVEGMLNYLLTDSVYRTLSDWEKEFVDSVSELPEDQPLSPGRLSKLREIYAEK